MVCAVIRFSVVMCSAGVVMGGIDHEGRTSVVQVFDGKTKIWYGHVAILSHSNTCVYKKIILVSYIFLGAKFLVSLMLIAVEGSVYIFCQLTAIHLCTRHMVLFYFHCSSLILTVIPNYD